VTESEVLYTTERTSTSGKLQTVDYTRWESTVFTQYLYIYML